MASIQTGSVFAKTIVLGDHGSGRNLLIHNLDLYKTARHAEDVRGTSSSSPSHYSTTESSNHFFTAIELTSHELDSSSQGVGGSGGAHSQGSHSHHSNAILKLWKYTENLSKKDEQLAFRGALFCIITFDICNAQSFKSVFEHWIPLKEQLSSDSFLYIVGTHLDRANYRQISLSEICKACAKKDAMYIEVSNIHGTNFPLLRKVLCKRVEYMLKQKEAFANRTNLSASLLQSNNSSNSNSNNNNNSSSSSGGNAAEEEKISTSDERNSLNSLNSRSVNNNTTNNNNNPYNDTTNSNQSELSLPFLEPHILSGSVGSILSSCFGLEEWQGYLQQEQELVAISERIDGFVTQLAKSAENTSMDIANIPINDDIFRTENADKPLTYLHDTPDLPHPQLEISEEEANQNAIELVNAFKILGLNVPKTLLPKTMPITNNAAGGNMQSPGPGDKLNASGGLDNTQNSNAMPGDGNTPGASGNINSSVPTGHPNAATSPVRPHLRKLLVKLPAGGSAEMILNLEHNVEQQIDMFLLSYGLGHDHEARRKLLQNVLKIQRDYIDHRQRLAAAGASAGLATTPGTGNGGGNSNNATPNNVK